MFRRAAFLPYREKSDDSFQSRCSNESPLLFSNKRPEGECREGVERVKESVKESVITEIYFQIRNRPLKLLKSQIVLFFLITTPPFTLKSLLNQ